MAKLIAHDVYIRILVTEDTPKGLASKNQGKKKEQSGLTPASACCRSRGRIELLEGTVQPNLVATNSDVHVQ
jgi:hypothetical protein